MLYILQVPAIWIITKLVSQHYLWLETNWLAATEVGFLR